MSDTRTIEIGGVWVRRKFEHLGGRLEVLVEIDGVWRLLDEWPATGMISHIFEPSGIVDKPVDPLEAFTRALETRDRERSAGVSERDLTPLPEAVR